MNRELIKSFVLGSNYYSFNIENYTIPKYIYTVENNKKLNIEDIRNNRLKTINESSYEKTFKFDMSILQGKAVIRKPLYNYLKEFPIMIENRELWNKLLDFYQFSPDDKLRNTNYFLLDFLFYNSDFIVEIDSNLHNEDYDKARDNYIKTIYGLDTLRFYCYGEDTVKRSIYLTKFKEKIKQSYYKRIKLGLVSGPKHLDFTETMVNNYIKENKESLLFIDSLARFLGISFNVEDSFNINYSDLHKISPKLFKRDIIYKELDPETIILNNSIGILYEIYGKVLNVEKSNKNITV